MIAEVCQKMLRIPVPKVIDEIKATQWKRTRLHWLHDQPVYRCEN